MNKSQLERIAVQNKTLIDDGTVDIPKTIKVDYGSIKIQPMPVIEGKTIHTTISFETMKTDECAIHYIENKLGKNIVVMNFASRHNHGGGYIGGAKAQEEDLCRVMPGLYASLCKIRYPYNADSVLITPNVNIMRNNINYSFFPRGITYNVGVVSAAAPSLRHEEYDEDRVTRTLENMYCAVRKLLPNTDTLIVGAWGCGAYGNDPVKMARLMNTISLKYGGEFKTIVFAVPEGANTKEFRENITRMCRNVYNYDDCDDYDDESDFSDES